MILLEIIGAFVILVLIGKGIRSAMKDVDNANSNHKGDTK